ncbi:MAG: EAL domain-containing protein [Thermodesulfovibrionia bacterium]|nr:EAL domain-containing protein [Thermodesulfovibrionia bacterium]
MTKKIILSLITLFIIFFAGAAVSMFYISDSASDVSNIIKLHQVGDLRRELLINLQSVQSTIYRFNTSNPKDLNSMATDVMSLNEKVSECFSCHHEPNINSQIMRVQSLVKDYENHISYFITGSSTTDRIDRYKQESISIGDDILAALMDMSRRAGIRLESLTTNSTNKINQIQNVLIITILATLFFSIIVAFRLTRFITMPVSKLLSATRNIASGNIGTTIKHHDKTEFGELAENFNIMSKGLKESYDELNKEITERIKTEDRLRESEERYMLAAQGANDGLWDWDLISNRIYYSPRWKSMLGYNDDEIKDVFEEWANHTHTNDIIQVETELKAHIDGLTPQFQNEQRMRHKDGTYRWMLTRGLAVRNESGKAYRMAGSQTDITERKVIEEQLTHDAFHDSLTNLPNRALFMDRLSHAIRRKTRKNENLFAVLFIDLDRFKVINDSLGHMAGDQLLIKASQCFVECLRPSDTVARFGGDEFAILLEEITDTNDVTALIKRVQGILLQPFTLREHEVFITLSIGIAFSYPNSTNPDNLLRNADIAMYHAKANGRNRYEIFNETMYKDIITSMKMESDMRKAIVNKEFQVFYQPFISLKDNRICGFEALIRWEHPEMGMIQPSEFIPLSEETGMIVPIGKWVLSEACRQICEWNAKFSFDIPLKMNVNISSKQFLPDLINQVKLVITTTKIDPKNLTLEITETLLMENAEMTAPLLQQLKDMGVMLQIDDFGTGYSSLSYLHNFPFDGLKIDRSFIAKIGTKDEKLEILKAIITLAQNLDLHVVAEGVETSEQFVKIKKLNCEYIQGFLLSKPLSAADAEIFLTDIDKLALLFNNMK